MQLRCAILVLLSLTNPVKAADLHALPPARFELYDMITPLLEPDGAAVPVASPPAFNSQPGATAQLYLDFNGHVDALWGGYQNVTTPVFDLDSNPATFNESEQAAIKEIFDRVSEDYAPFNINVTTVEPASFADRVGMRVAIGGNGSWYGNAGGVAYRNSFTSNGIVNTAHVFPGKLNNNSKYIAEASSHEAGHSFGLAHQSRYDAAGVLLDTYHPGANGWAPIMGLSYYQARSTWHDGATISATILQQDVARLSGAENAFGLKPDDHGDTASTARPLNVSGKDVSHAGLIGTLTDKDYFSFTTGTGVVSLTVNVAAVGPNLDCRIELRDAADVLIASAAPTGSLGASITASLTSGSYRLVVASAGRYGDLGRYTITGKIAAPISLLTTQQRLLRIDARSKAGNPATLDGAPVWTSSNPAVLRLTPAADGMTAMATAVGVVGASQVRVVADAKLGAGVREMVFTADVEVTDN